ncbi:Oidioi.mRNA.OKI2018_I69.PAR.g8606.t1.cds [Oikopleura dioica]|uniref:Oidioi.mRNA.OKI2018_I69.PAR.g8606.t1.cds n=1 Tax=Oikopleura dioica TaxID=34765 RepID=A0ABN7RGR1_OIKDI|nr:Oidioi.mRNA.OKI2018_I69.PAR.g8606.t1.cds [Oikopleura dioica]
MFGTFADRDADRDYKDEKIAYGLIPPVNSFEYFTVQFHSLKKLIIRFFKTPEVINKLKVLFYGPGWNPKDNIRLGDPAKLPKIHKGDEKKFHDPEVSSFLGLYGLLQMALTALVLDHFLNLKTNEYSFALNMTTIIWIFWSMCSVGIMMEGVTTFMEIMRVALTSWYFYDSETFPERKQLPIDLFIPFLLSSVAAVFLKLQKSTSNSAVQKIKPS